MNHNLTNISISNGLYHWIHNSNIDKVDKSSFGYLVIKIKISGSTHDGYCSDSYNYHDYEKFSYVKIPILCFTDDFINLHFTDDNYNGSINDIISYLKDEKNCGFTQYKIINQLDNIGKHKSGSPYCGSCHCEATSFTQVVSIKIRYRSFIK